MSDSLLALLSEAVSNPGDPLDLGRGVGERSRDAFRGTKDSYYNPTISTTKPLEIKIQGRSQHTRLLGTQVGLSPLFNRSISSARSEVVVGHSSGSGLVDFGYSCRRPSQNSVRMLSSDGLDLKTSTDGCLCLCPRLLIWSIPWIASGRLVVSASASRVGSISSFSILSRKKGMLMLGCGLLF